MKALVIGGTKGFGKEVVQELAKRDYELVTVGRSETDLPGQNFICDIGDLKEWEMILEKIKLRHPAFDLVIFIAGFARAKSFQNLSLEDWHEHLNKNLLYVALALQQLEKVAKIVTIGSQWSYKVGSDELVPYTIAKHALNTLTKDFAVRNPAVMANHYCVPSMRTPQAEEVSASFEKMGRVYAPTDVANPIDIAGKLVQHMLDYQESGKTLAIDARGIITQI